MMKFIKLTRGQFAIVDDEDFDWLSHWHWWAHYKKERHVFYARRSQRLNGRIRHFSMSREILNADSNQLVDHINHNTVDNRRSNLRLCNHTGSSCNRRIHSNNQSGFLGVRRQDKKYSATICLNGKDYHLGRFDTAEEAARMRDSFAIKLHGKFACLNQL
jgi:hypothetical protein